MERKVLALALLALLVMPAFLGGRAFADGLFQENLPPATIGDRQAVLFVRINPPVLTSDTIQDAFLQLRLFNAKNNETIKFTTFIITVTKGTDPDAKPILTDAFHTESGLLTLKIEPQEGPVTIFGTQEDFLKSWKADPGGTINIRGPILLEGGLYHFKIVLLTVDNIRNLFKDEDAPVFDTYLSVGDIFRQDVEFEGGTYPTTIISYYDRVRDFSFDPGTMTYSWSMPFDWDVDRLKAVPNIFVHEEIKIPKSFEGVGDAVSFDAKVSGVPVAGRAVAVDPFSSETELVLHFLLNKNDIIDVAGKVPQGSSAMEFEFSPSSGLSGETTGDITTDNGGLTVRLEWKPDPLSAGDESTVDVKFLDAFSGDRITDDVVYDLAVFDVDHNEVYAVLDQTAEGGAGSQVLTFPADESYRVQVTVKAIQREGQAPDLTRNGIARGIVFVPEFPSGALIAVAGILGAVIAFQRLKARK